MENIENTGKKPITYEEIIALYESEEAYQLTLRAIEYAKKAHAGQTRKDKDESPYIDHIKRVGHLVFSSKYPGKADTVTLCAAILHDTLEDTDTNPEELEELFGKEVCDVVQELSDNKALSKKFRKMLRVRDADRLSERAATVILADKIDNLRWVLNSPPEHWTQDDKIEYLEWANAVIENLSFKPTRLYMDFIIESENLRLSLGLGPSGEVI